MILKNKPCGLRLFFYFTMILSSLFSLQTTFAQTKNGNHPPALELVSSGHNEKFSPADSDLQMVVDEMKQYMKDKYNADDVGLRDEIDPSLKNKRRIISIRGDLTPKKSFVARTGKYGLPRAAAETFLADEAEQLFGIKNPIDIRESNSFGTEFSIVIGYQRYVGGLPLQNAEILVGCKEDGKLTDITAYLVPVTAELLDAVTRETLSETEIRKIVADDLARKDVLQAPIEWIEKMAIPVSPYVVWEVKTDWSYTIDAFSGKILQKLQGWQD